MKKILLAISFAIALMCSNLFAATDISKVKDIERTQSCVDALTIKASDTLICENKGGVITLTAKFSVQDSLDFIASGATLFWSINGIDTIPNMIRLDSKYVKITVPAPTTTTTYTVRLNPAPVGGCANPVGTKTVIVKLVPTDANAGLNQIGAPTCGLTSINLAAVKVATGHGQGKWSFDGDSTGGAFANATLNNTAFTGTPGKLYIVRWTTSNAPCAASTDTALVKLNQNPDTARAGSDQIGASTCGLTSVNLDANVPVVGKGKWTVTKASDNDLGAAVLADDSNPKSAFSGKANVTYTLYWTISNAPCADSKDSVLVKFNQNPSTAEAGADSTGAETCGKTSITLKANNPIIGVGTWSVVTGAGGAFGNDKNAVTPFTGTPNVPYTLRWTVTNAPCAASTDDVNVTFNQNPDSAKAGADIVGAETCGLNTISLKGNTPVIGTGTWSIISGVGGSFVDDKSSTTAFNGTSDVSYDLVWTIANTPCKSDADTVTVKFHTNTPDANAGADQIDRSTCGKTIANLNGNVPQVGTGLWTIVAGNGGVVGDKNAAVTTLNGAPDSTYTLTWTITNAPCVTKFDTVVVKFNRNPSKPDAGIDQVGTQTCGKTTISLKANSPAKGDGGKWDIISGVGGSFLNDSDSITDFTGQAGSTYVVSWTITNFCGLLSDSAKITFNENINQASVGNQVICDLDSNTTASLNSTAINGVGTWSLVSSSSVHSGTFDNKNDGSTTFRGHNSTTYVVQWKIVGLCGSDSATGKIDFRVKPNQPLIIGDDTLQLCNASSVNLRALTPDSNDVGMLYNWTKDGLSISNSDTLSITVNTSGRYQVIAYKNTCENQSNIITIIDRIKTPQSLNDTICQGVDYKVLPYTTKGNKYSWYKLDSNAVIGVDSFLVVNIKKKQVFVLQIIDSICGSLKPDTFFVDVFPQSEAILSAYDTICLGSSVELTVSVTKDSAPKYKYFWYANNSLIKSDTLTQLWVLPTLEVTKYTVAVKDTNGCISTADKNINAVEWDLNEPNIFTPNGDAYNQEFKVRKAPNTTISLEVYNRWGAQIYKSDDYNNTWDGDGASDGVYYYTMRPTCPNKTIQKWVQIAR
jgi:gliding motility-associated-like protein